MTGPALPAEFLRKPLAHRGLHDAKAAGRPENSRAAVRAAVAQGYGVEIDVQLSRDGVAMVFHDDRLARMTGHRGKLCEHDAATLAGLALKDGDGEGIPRLGDLMAEIAGRAPVLIELKDQSGGRHLSDGRLEAAVADAVHGCGGPVAAMSFVPAAVMALAHAAPDLPRGLTTGRWTLRDAPRLGAVARAHLRAIRDFDSTGASFVSHDWRDLARAELATLKAQGVPILCWTLRSPREEAIARKTADGITFEGYLPTLPPKAPVGHGPA
ncbi:glycerophosphodiester phosphodiesterase family protein [Alkalilacustris brevis]|uniref:glycerophosphodiester phosphodiesterase family protein n=1 Tax=Alkalilacustris brevis TaxID=2026338 RepID=UPI000E0DBDBC|nr:glycerophosphodiester phosphodiesterase family protein [Alkalilacustris brevis]